MVPISNGNNRPRLLRILVSTLMTGVLVCSTALAQDAAPAQPVLASDTLVAAVSAPPVTGAADTSSVSSSSVEALPNAPSAMLRGSAVDFNGQTTASGPEAPRLEKYISAGWTAQRLTARDKVLIGFRDSVTPFSFLAIIVSAGYSHVTNGEPNYGTDKGAFGQRLGATAIRDTSEDIFTDSVYAPLLHEDPRYYVEGPQHGFFQRIIYAATRPLITRTDSGRSTVNGAQLLGAASSSAVSYTYYPQVNKNFGATASTFGGALAGDALGDVVSEFSDEVLVMLHLKKKM